MLLISAAIFSGFRIPCVPCLSILKFILLVLSMVLYPFSCRLSRLFFCERTPCCFRCRGAPPSALPYPFLCYSDVDLIAVVVGSGSVDAPASMTTSPWIFQPDGDLLERCPCSRSRATPRYPPAARPAARGTRAASSRRRRRRRPSAQHSAPAVWRGCGCYFRGRAAGEVSLEGRFPGKHSGASCHRRSCRSWLCRSGAAYAGGAG
jgi:hypothetical protein